MRNVLVVLVLSCIGLSCGFIAPSGIREIIEDFHLSENSIENSESKPRNMIKSRTLNTSSVNSTSDLSTRSIKIHHNSTNSLDNDLYENSGKNATIEERAFIYIKQRAKKPYLKNVFEVMSKTNFDHKPIKPYVLSHPILDDISRHFLTENVENKFFNTHFGQLEQTNYQSKINNFVKYYIDEERRLQNEKNCDKKGKHSEVIKSPLPRPIIKTNEKDFISMENSLFNFTIGRKLLEDIQESLSSKGTIKSKKYELNENTANDINNEEGATVSDERIVNENIDQVVKRVMGNQILGRKSNRIDHKGFYFCRDCFKKGKEQASNNRVQLESICNCGQNRLMKLTEDDIAK